MYNRFPEELIEEIRINNDIVDVVSEYVRLDRKGKDYFGLCPFHKEKTPSFSVVPAKQIFYCFGCGKGGNVVQFIMHVENLDYVEALKLLAERAKIQLPEGESKEEAEQARRKKEILKLNVDAAHFFYGSLSSSEGEQAKQYLDRRKIRETTIRKFGLGYSPEQRDSLYKYLKAKGYSDRIILESGLVMTGKHGGFYDRFRNRVMFPIFDVRGNVIGFGGRVLDASMPKYMNSPETPVYHKGKSLYALNFAKNSGEKRLIIVEGYMDVISLHQNGILNTVASLGTALTESQGRILKKYAEEIIISYDTDSAGQSATMRGLNLLDDIGCSVRVLTIPDGKDPDEYISRNGADDFRRLVNGSLSLVEYKIKVLKNQMDTDTTDGRIKFLNKVADILSKVDNSVEREMYVKKLADEYKITQESLFSEVYRRIKPRARLKTAVVKTAENTVRSMEKPEKSINNRMDDDEKMLLAMLCTDHSAYKAFKNRISVDLFMDEDNRQLAATVLERLENNKGLVAAELMSMVDDRAAGIYAAMFNELSFCDDIKKAVLSKIREIELCNLMKRQKKIIELLRNEQSMEKGDVERLKLELRDLVMQIKNQKSS